MNWNVTIHAHNDFLSGSLRTGSRHCHDGKRNILKFWLVSKLFQVHWVLNTCRRIHSISWNVFMRVAWTIIHIHFACWCQKLLDISDVSSLAVHLCCTVDLAHYSFTSRLCIKYLPAVEAAICTHMPPCTFLRQRLWNIHWSLLFLFISLCQAAVQRPLAHISQQTHSK